MIPLQVLSFFIDYDASTVRDETRFITGQKIVYPCLHFVVLMTVHRCKLPLPMLSTELLLNTVHYPAPFHEFVVLELQPIRSPLCAPPLHDDSLFSLHIALDTPNTRERHSHLVCQRSKASWTCRWSSTAAQSIPFPLSALFSFPLQIYRRIFNDAAPNLADILICRFLVPYLGGLRAPLRVSCACPTTVMTMTLMRVEAAAFLGAVCGVASTRLSGRRTSGMRSLKIRGQEAGRWLLCRRFFVGGAKYAR